MNGSSPTGQTILYDFAACRDLDRQTTAAGFPEQQLMGQAALASCQALLGRARAAAEAGGRIIVLCGSGNNGGDGYALAFMLLSADAGLGPALRLFATGEPRSQAARFYADRVVKCGLRVVDATEITDGTFRAADLIIEALLGIGQNTAPRGVTATVVAALLKARNARHAPQLISLDVPVGLTETGPVRFVPPGRTRVDGPSGAAPEGTAPLPDENHSYGVEKLALRIQPDLAARATLRVLPIGFLPQDGQSPQARLFRSSAPDAGLLTRRALDQKYSAGHAFVAGGSAGMEGALLLSARAFFAAGGGILHAFTAASAEHTWAEYPAAMFRDLTSLSDGKLPPVVVVGPGASPQDCRVILAQLALLIERARSAAAGPPVLILDAGALELAGELLLSLTPAEKGNVLLTPHQGEWERLGGQTPDCVEALRAANDFNRTAFGCYALVKGPVSCLFSPEGETFVFSRPNASLAVAGSGDVLVGIMAAIGSRRQDSPLSIPELVENSLRVHSHAGSATRNPDALELIEAIRSWAENPKQP